MPSAHRWLNGGRTVNHRAVGVDGALGIDNSVLRPQLPLKTALLVGLMIGQVGGRQKCLGSEKVPGRRVQVVDELAALVVPCTTSSGRGRDLAVVPV